eukprot:XP_001693190.1 predicted protein [Chlamydomonas reinhardtii]
MLSRSSSFTSSPVWTWSPGSSSSETRSPVNGVSSTVKALSAETPRDDSPLLLDSASWRPSPWCSWAEDVAWAEAAAKVARLNQSAQAEVAEKAAASAAEDDVDMGEFELMSCVECLGL